ncbi:UNVERIFIED_CONTAM: hypothetical protein FKN15_049399 [Acipenser sinensis]
MSLTGTQAQNFGEECLDKFTPGKPDFILDTDDSVKDGATFLASPNVSQWKECVRACCMQPKCNLAFMEEADFHCFLFDCLHKQSYVCRFIKKTGYVNYILSSVSKEYLEGHNFKPDSDKPPSALVSLDRVVQPQETVTLGAIESKDDHGIVDYKWDLVQGNPTVQWQKTDLDDQVVVSNLNEGTYVFQLTVTDTVGQTDSANVTILVLTKEQSEDSDKPPSALVSLDRVVQPQETVTLGAIESKDDHGIVDYKWDLVQGNPTVQWQVLMIDLSPVSLQKQILTESDKSCLAAVAGLRPCT